MNADNLHGRILKSPCTCTVVVVDQAQDQETRTSHMVLTGEIQEDFQREDAVWEAPTPSKSDTSWRDNVSGVEAVRNRLIHLLWRRYLDYPQSARAVKSMIFPLATGIKALSLKQRTPFPII